MKKIFFLIILPVFFSCGKDKVVLLPEISHSEITEIKDVSAAYLFYDETKKDSVELNRQNLISTTNWLVNVDKRLTLKQVIPHIKFLQDKKRNSSHKNKNAKNYFTCNDTSKKNLGFIEFTDVVYKNSSIINLLAEENQKLNSNLIIHFTSLKDIKINSFFNKMNLVISNYSELINDIKSSTRHKNNKVAIKLYFKNVVSFQDYISIKSILSELKNEAIIISNEEFISN